jgi:hypothetical protein
MTNKNNKGEYNGNGECQDIGDGNCKDDRAVGGMLRRMRNERDDDALEA